jgi:hypothetical protein
MQMKKGRCLQANSIQPEASRSYTSRILFSHQDLFLAQSDLGRHSLRQPHPVQEVGEACVWAYVVVFGVRLHEH